MLKFDTFGRSSDWQKVFISLVWNNSRKLPLKPPFSDASSCLEAEWLSPPPPSFKKPNCATKEKTVQIFSTTLRRWDERSEHEKQSSKAIFILLQFWSAEIKVAYGCHRDASHSGRLTTTRGICAFLNHVCPGRLRTQLTATGATHPHKSGRDNLKLPLFFFLQRSLKSRLGYK